MGWTGVLYRQSIQHEQAQSVVLISLSYLTLFRTSTAKVVANEFFTLADKDGDKKLAKDEIRTILLKMHINIHKKAFDVKFDEFDEDKNGVIDKHEFGYFMQHLLRKEELLLLFKKHAKRFTGDPGAAVMNLNELINFYQVEQDTVLPRDEATEIIARIKDECLSPTRSSARHFLSFHEFSALIFSNWNLIFNPELRSPHQVPDIHFLRTYELTIGHDTTSDRLLCQHLA